MRKLLLIFALLLIAIPEQSVLGQSGGLIDSTLEQLILNNISGERALDYITKISRFHRIRGGGPGSGYNDAVDFVVAELNKMGLDEVQVDRFKSDGFTTYETWPTPVGWRLRSAKLWLVEPEFDLLCDASATTVSLMPYSNSGKAEAEVIYVGEGKSEDDYEGLDVKGKIVLAAGGNGRAVHQEAVIKRGALGVVVGPSHREDRLEFPDLIEMHRLMPTGPERKKTGWGFSLSRRQMEQLVRLVESGKKLVMRAEVDAELFDGEMPVISALIRGAKHPEQEILLLAHLDHYKPGANDNASGSAGLMEIARSVTEMITRDEMPRPTRSIRFLWLPEMHGSMAYVDKYKDLGDRALVGINLDMIGEDYAKCRSYLAVTSPPFSAPSYLADVMATMIEWANSHDFFSPRGTHTYLNYRTPGYWSGSDHIIYSDATIGIPSLMLVHADIFHHSSYDTPDKCDPTELRRVTAAATMAALTIANADDEMAIKIAARVAERGLGRLHRRTERSLSLLESEAKKEDFADKAGQVLRPILRYEDIVGDVERKSVLSTRELCESEKTREYIVELSERLTPDVESDKARLVAYFDYLTGQQSELKLTPRLTDAEREAKNLRPRRLFRGPLYYGYLEDNLGENYQWYRDNAILVGGRMGDKIYEIVNFADGQHDLLWIRDAVSAEFGETDVQFAKHLVEDLRKLELMSY